MNVLIIGKVWPEPQSSAAGWRILQLIELFRHQNWEITFASAASESEYSANLESLSIKTTPIRLNDPSFHSFIEELKPDLVLFDRYMTEEQFGWKVREACPNAIQILDTEDLHGVREGRKVALKEKRPFIKEDLLNKISLREIASIFRCDLSLIISEYEMNVLKSSFQVEDSLLHYTPFFLEPIDEELVKKWKGYDSREHFVWIGNFLHEPNWDTVQYLKKEIWPSIKKEIPKAELHIYGAYAGEKAFNLHNEGEGFLVKGRALDVEDVFQNARVLLAPIRFGAGLKGKLVEAMQYGLPSVTTEIGAEGIPGKLAWPGAIGANSDELINKAIALYSSPEKWVYAQALGVNIINKRFTKQTHMEALIRRINELRGELKQHRTNNFIGSMLHHHTLSSSKFMGKWIEEKNRTQKD